MKISHLKIIPILVGLLACQAQACQSLRKKGWYVKIYKADYEEQLKELDEAKAKEKELSQKLQEEKNRNNISAIIQEEERILEMGERQELPVDSREEYAYLPAERDDKDIDTGRLKYLPCRQFDRREAVSPTDLLELVKSSLMAHQESS